MDEDEISERQILDALVRCANYSLTEDVLTERDRAIVVDAIKWTKYQIWSLEND